MKTEFVDVSPTRKEIKIEIDPAAIKQSYDEVSDRYAKQASVPGFRPGHAPRAVVRNRFKSEIRAEVLQHLIPDAVNQAIDKHALNAIKEPDVELENAAGLEKFGEEPISVKVNVEVLPKVEVQNYKGLEVARRVRPISDANVEEMFDAFRETSAAMQPVEDRPSANGDTVTVNLVGKFLDNPDQENIKADDVEVELGGRGVQPEFTESLTGVKADDEKIFTVSYPEDFKSEGLAGKRVEYTAKVTAVRVKELPEIDDEWAKSLGEEFDSVTTLRTKIREDLEKRATQESDHRLRADLMAKLLEQNQFEVPQSLIEQQTSRRLESIVRDMIGRGVDPRNQQLNWEAAREELKTQAEADVRSTLLLERIADEEKIEVSSEDIDAEIEAIALSSQQPIEQVRGVLTKDGGERSIAHRLRNRKALDLLVENAKVAEAEWSETEETEIGSQSSE
ncbi:MAG TPA: trigger factor [Pyrinomonadaceae bacterium]|jgi:trigger factor|nr:trigger factor [Pyrinomonadaceae bacterium]